MENYYRYEINWKDLVNEKKRTNNSSSYSHKINSSRYDNFKDRTNFNNTITSSDSYKSLIITNREIATPRKYQP